MTNAFSTANPRPHYDADLQTELSAIGWQGRLNECLDEHDVVQTVRDYLARLEPEEIASLPEGCRPGRFVDAQDVSDFALQLARAQCDSGEPLVDKMAAFMTNASLRLAQILARASEVSSEDPPG